MELLRTRSMLRGAGYHFQLFCPRSKVVARPVAAFGSAWGQFPAVSVGIVIVKYGLEWVFNSHYFSMLSDQYTYNFVCVSVI